LALSSAATGFGPAFTSSTSSPAFLSASASLAATSSTLASSAALLDSSAAACACLAN
jgi:hypothetical protein